jgi:hypothetical protein
VFISAAIAIAKQISVFFQVEDCRSKATAFLAGELWKFSQNFRRTHDRSN